MTSSVGTDAGSRDPVAVATSERGGEDVASRVDDVKGGEAPASSSSESVEGGGESPTGSAGGTGSSSGASGEAPGGSLAGAGEAAGKSSGDSGLEASFEASIASLELKPAPIFHGRTGVVLSWDELVERGARADVVVFGEVHGHATTQAFMALMFEEIAARRAGTVALSLEFFARDQQLAMDDYLTGVTDEETFRAATHRSGSSYPPGHRAMVEVARDAGRPVVAANAPRRYAKLARLEGFSRLKPLTPEQRRLFVLPARLTKGPYRERFFEAMKDMPAHDANGKKKRPDVRGFFRAQNLWDATMADALVRATDEGVQPVVHVVGRFHSDFDGGLAERIREGGPGLDLFVVSFVDAHADALRPNDQGRADVVVYVGEE